MNPHLNAARVGLFRGWTEFLATFRSLQELLLGYLLIPVVFLVMALYFLDGDVEGLGVGAVHMVAGIALMIAMLGVSTVAQVLATEREDGTLLRSRAVPHGMVEYAVGKTLHVFLMSLIALALMVVPAMLFVDGVALQGAFGFFTLLWVCMLGLLSLAPLGAIFGSLINNPKNGPAAAMLPIVALVVISGLYFPLEYLPGWLQAIALIFPLHWIGEGLRAALIPSEFTEAGLFGASELALAAGVLVLWAVLGFFAAQRVLRRMARRESGSRVQAARERAMQRVY